MVLAILPDRLKETVKAFLLSIPAPLKATLQRVCSDRYEGYTNAAREALAGHEPDYQSIRYANETFIYRAPGG